MKNDEFKIGLDALKLCFTDEGENVLFERLFNGSNMLWWGEENGTNFYTFRVEKESDDDVQIVNIEIPDMNETSLLGCLAVHRKKEKAKYNGMIFLSIENKALYSGLLHYLPYVLSCFHVKFNNITLITPALTTTRNYIYQVQKMRTDENYEMIYNMKKIADPEATIKDWVIAKGCSRRKIQKIPTLYFGQAKESGIQIRMYDKNRELKEKSPEKRPIINSWLDFDYEKLYRVEADITNVSMRELCVVLNNFDTDYFHDDRILSFLFNEKFLFLLLSYALNKVVYWRKDGKMIELLDL